MAVIAVINGKGGVGKSTLATQLSGYLAALGLDVMLGDVDKQQSSRLWLNLRAQELPRIRGWIFDERNFARPPAGVKYVVLDTPAGLHGMALMKVVMNADAIIVPTMSSIFDLAAAEASIKELRTFPRVASGKCQLATLGMRIDSRTRNATVLQNWAAGLAVTNLGSIRALQVYSQCLDRGMTIFDFPPARAADCLKEWAAVTDWLQRALSLPDPQPAISAPPPDDEEPVIPEFLRK